MKDLKIIPFYMAYPLPIYYKEEDEVMQDLEYLQQMYPAQIKQYQKKIAGVLDKIDYNGSMIYDEYPDKLSLYKMGKDICEIIKAEEKREQNENIPSEEKWEWVEQLIQVLLFYEIYKRRHTHKSGILKF